jgi:hypothetical protein
VRPGDGGGGDAVATVLGVQIVQRRLRRSCHGGRRWQGARRGLTVAASALMDRRDNIIEVGAVDPFGSAAGSKVGGGDTSPTYL